jgi:periplasmic mercuric ion binding protein
MRSIYGVYFITKRRKHMSYMAKLVITLAFGITLMAAQAEAAEQKTTLMLGGHFCEFYPKEITDALMAVKGVKAVDLKSMKGHAVVTHDESVKPEELVAAMNGVKGTKMGIEWYCTAEVAK